MISLDPFDIVPTYISLRYISRFGVDTLDEYTNTRTSTNIVFEYTLVYIGIIAQWQVSLSWKSSYRLLFKVHVLTYCVFGYKNGYKTKSHHFYTPERQKRVGNTHRLASVTYGRFKIRENARISQLNFSSKFKSSRDMRRAKISAPEHSRTESSTSLTSTLRY